MRALRALLVLVALVIPTMVRGLDCSGIGGSDNDPGPGDCTLNAAFNCTTSPTQIDIPGDLIVNAMIDCAGTSPGAAGRDLIINVGGDLDVNATVTANGAAGASGGVDPDNTGGNGSSGGAAGDITIDVGRDVSIGALVTARGGAGGSGGAADDGDGGNGAVGAVGGAVSITADGKFTLESGITINAGGGAGGPGGAGAGDGNGGNGAAGAAAGSVDIFSCETLDQGSILVNGGAGGAGGAGAGAGNGGNGASGADGGTITQESGTDLTLTATAVRAVQGGSAGAAGAGGPGGTAGSPGASAGNPGTTELNVCPSFSIIDGGATFLGDTDPTQSATAPCCPCAIEITKEVALDDDCDGTADGAFADSVTQLDTECVVYRICVTNTGDQDAGMDDVPQSIDGVTVDDGDLGISTAAFAGPIAPGNQFCQEVPGDVTAADCDAGQCVCADVEGTNTASVSAAQCVVDQSDACDTGINPNSDCDDTASVACESCSLVVDKTVALDDDCDGSADGGFSDSVSQDADQCVVYRVCVENTGDQNLTGVMVNDTGAGGTGGSLDFGTVNSGATECQDIPTDAAVGDCSGGTCLCSAVEGTNTAQVSSATCGTTGEDACDQEASDCEDDAEVECLTCGLTVDKTVALDDNCDGTAEGGFSNSVVQDPNECVVYQICVSNIREQDITGVMVEDTGVGGTGGSLDFGTVASMTTECQLIPTQAAVGDCSGGSCLCTAVEGTNTATVSSAVCGVTGDDACQRAASDCSDDANVDCQSCSLEVTKMVALDDNCDGTANGAFSDSVTQEANECVVYEICVENTGQQNLTGVTVNDTGAGGTGGSLNFGTVNAGATECQRIPTTAAVGDCSGGTCLCTAVEGPNTVQVGSATCQATGESACTFTVSICSDSAEVECTVPCSVEIEKTVALDDDCDGTADAPYGESVVAELDECVVYRICVENTGEETLDASGVAVSDPLLGIVDVDFGTITPGNSVCRLVPSQIPSESCPDDMCPCRNVQGVNTAEITSAVCSPSGADACDNPSSSCEDDATVRCKVPPAPAPALSEWGLLLAMLILSSVAFFRIRQTVRA